MRTLTGVLTIVALLVCTSAASAESVYVKYRGEIDLTPFDCTDISRSSFIRRVCYDRRNEYMLISLNGTFYHYCERRYSGRPFERSINGQVLQCEH